MSLSFQQDIYSITNFSITDQFAPFLMTKNVVIDVRFTGNVKKNSNSIIFLVHAECIGSSLLQ